MTDRKGGGDVSPPDYPAVTVESSQASIDTGISRARVQAGLRKRKNWEQLAKFCVVGATGYAVNLAVFATLVQSGFHYIPAAMASFLVAVTNNYMWNRLWTFRHDRGHFGYQGLRFLVVSGIVYLCNLAILTILVELGLGKIVAQAIAIVLVTPANFIGNKLWSFRSQH